MQAKELRMKHGTLFFVDVDGKLKEVRVCCFVYMCACVSLFFVDVDSKVKEVRVCGVVYVCVRVCVSSSTTLLVNSKRCMLL